MKKISKLSLILCLCFLLQSFCLPVSALEATEAEDPFAAINAANQKLEFGDYCVQQGCRTIEGMVPLGGTDRKLATAQAAFLYETRTETVVYSYNPDMKISPGNLTKIVTAIVTLEHAGLDQMVTCGLNVTRHGGSVGLRLRWTKSCPSRICCTAWCLQAAMMPRLRWQSMWRATSRDLSH